SPSPTHSPPPTPTPTSTTPPPPPPPGHAGVTQSDFFFTPRVVTTHTGDRLTTSNVSPTSPHTFTISSKGIDVVNNAGQTQSITIKLNPGSYPFVCTSHHSLGMTATRIVSAPGTKPA